VAKRSPILGYNHNVRYRGLVFHVQTEDSGVLSPHLFTHLFHEGVIVSTRKLVYDAGASEDAIKALMQAQHKAVLKDLNRRQFDDKIDQYLGQVPGLEPRSTGPARASEPTIAKSEAAAPESAPSAESAPVAVDPSEPTPPSIEIVRDDLVGTAPTRQLDEAAQQALARQGAEEAVREAAARVAAAQQAARDSQEPAAPPAQQSRTTTAERTSRSSQFRSMPPPQPDGVPVEVNAGPTIPTPAPPQRPTPTPPPTPQRPVRAATPPPIPSRSRAGITLNVDSSPEIEIIPAEVDPEESNRARTTRDTDIDEMIDSGVPAMVADDLTRPSDGVPGRVGSDSAPPQNRPASHGAATLPAVRPPSRPSITPAQVVSRPLPPEQRNRENTDAIEVYAPAPQSAELPGGERPATDRAAGTYSMNRRQSEQIPPLNRVAIPSGLARPRTPAVGSATGSTTGRPPSSEGRSKQPSDGVPIVDPKRAPHTTAPIASRPQTANAGSQGNVVMTRPAVIVGAPAKPATGAPTSPRVRKAREDEGRGFGQGLISEKSLDEVILAYLSEDAEEK